MQPKAAPMPSTFSAVNRPVEGSADAIKDALVRQLYSPVRWTETVQALVAQGVTQSYEFGPGKVLTGLAKRIDKAMVCGSVNDLASIDTAK